MAVNDEHPTSVRQTMDGVLLHNDVAVGAEKSGEHFVVVTWDVNDPRAFARFAENLLDDVVVLLQPVTAATQLPDVDQIAHDIKRFAFVFAQEVEQRAGVAASRAQVHIGNPSRSHAARIGCSAISAAGNENLGGGEACIEIVKKPPRRAPGGLLWT